MIYSSLRPQGHGLSRKKADVRILEIRREAGPNDSARVDWILVDRKVELEKDPRTQETHRAKISVFYWDLTATGPTNSDVPDGEFSGYYDKGFNGLSITSSCLSTGGYVVVDPPRLRGGRLGTYLMNEIVCWARQWPDVAVREVTLLAGDGGNIQNRSRRNRFYESFGLEFDYADEDQTSGVSRPIRAGNLKEVTTWTRTITEHGILDYVRSSLSTAAETAVTARIQNESYAALRGELGNAERHPIRWIFKLWLTDHPMGFATTLACLSLGAWILYTFA